MDSGKIIYEKQFPKLTMTDYSKMLAETENRPFALTGDSFPKIIVRHDIRKRWYDDNGVLNIGVIDFLLDESII